MHSQLFRRVVQTLMISEDAVPAALGDGAAVLVTGAQTSVHVVAWTRGPAELFDRLLRHVEALEGGGDLVVVGGPTDAWDLLERACPPSKGVSLHHVAEDETVRQPSAGLFGKQRLAALNQLRPPSAEDDARFAAEMRRGLAEFNAQVSDLREFGSALSKRRPWATWILVATCVALFIFQAIWTDRELVASYLRMGALPGNLAETGEWWRLFSATLLHGSPEHLIFNMFVLYSLGSFIERLVGTQRFLLLYGASALAGSLASAWFLAPERFSVGASGALWGILAADAVLAFVRQDLLPAAVIPQARRNAAINLGLNILVSFQPNIDMAAHFGGGLMGAVITFTGLLTFGVGRARQDALPAPPRWMSATALGFTLALGGCMGIALAQGQPWSLKGVVTLTAVELDDLTTRIDAPASMAHRKNRAPDGTVVITFGDARRDAVGIDLVVIELPEETPIAQAIKELEGASDTPPLPGAKPTGAAQSEPNDGAPLVQRRYALDNGVLIERAFRYEGRRLWRVDVAYHPRVAGRWQGVARRMVSSARSLR